MNNYLKNKINSFLKNENMKISMIYYDSHMSTEIIQNVFDDNCDDFQHVNFIFFTKIHYFEDYLMIKLTLK
jgi:hypothetical protein